MNVVLKNFIDLSMDEKIKVLSWRNHDDIRKWMYRDDIILEKEHFTFIELLEKISKEQYFLVYQNNIDIGVIYFTNIQKDNCDIGLYSNPFLKGYGNLLMETIIEYAKNTLQLNTINIEVFTSNDKAINLYRKFNFEEKNRKIINNKEIIFMECRV